MKNTFGNNLQVTLFGESHGPAVGIVLDGLCPGLRVDETSIAHQLSLRRPSGKISTSRVEEDAFEILSGVYRGRTTGTPLTILIPNRNVKSGDYEEVAHLARPGHADVTAQMKYHGFQDPRGGGHFSGRITAALVAGGAVVSDALKGCGIEIGTHIAQCKEVKDRSFFAGEDASLTERRLKEDIASLCDKNFPVLDEAQEEKMRSVMEAAANEGDSVGGILETAIVGHPAGLGEPWFDTMESTLAHGLFSVPAVKGVQFGHAFSDIKLPGSQYNDAFYMEGDRICTRTNHNAGINGGITNGMPILFSVAVKPTPSIYKTQQTVDYLQKTDEELKLVGRHDPSILHRACVVINSISAFVLYDMLAGRLGTDFFAREDDR